MMGRLNHEQGQLFYSFCLDEAVPDDHLVREIAAVLDLVVGPSELVPYYPKMGRPLVPTRGTCSPPRRRIQDDWLVLLVPALQARMADRLPSSELRFHRSTCDVRPRRVCGRVRPSRVWRHFFLQFSLPSRARPAAIMHEHVRRLIKCGAHHLVTAAADMTVIKYIANDMPAGTQIILGVETPTDEHFDKVVNLDVAYHLLESAEFEEVEGLLTPYVEAMYLSLLGPNAAAN